MSRTELRAQAAVYHEEPGEEDTARGESGEARVEDVGGAWYYCLSTLSSPCEAHCCMTSWHLGRGLEAREVRGHARHDVMVQEPRVPGLEYLAVAVVV